MARKRGRVGRPPVGAYGEKVSEYPQVMIRLPSRTKALLDALSGVTGTPIWQLIDQAVQVYVAQLPELERRLLEGVRTRRAAEKRQRQRKT
jgi:hypothetical protein